MSSQSQQQQQQLQLPEGSDRIRFLVAALGDASKNAAAAMELQVRAAAMSSCWCVTLLQSMALDSANQLAIARSGALQGLSVMVGSGDILQVLPNPAALCCGCSRVRRARPRLARSGTWQRMRRTNCPLRRAASSRR